MLTRKPRSDPIFEILTGSDVNQFVAGAVTVDLILPLSGLPEPTGGRRMFSSGDSIWHELTFTYDFTPSAPVPVPEPSTCANDAAGLGGSRFGHAQFPTLFVAVFA